MAVTSGSDHGRIAGLFVPAATGDEELLDPIDEGRGWRDASAQP